MLLRQYVFRFTEGFAAALRGLRRTASAAAARILTGVQMLRYSSLADRSGLFDRNHYLSQNPDVAKSRVPPLKHYFIRGAYERRDPTY